MMVASPSILQRMNQTLSALPWASCKKSKHTMVGNTAAAVFEVGHGDLEKDRQLDQKWLAFTTNKGDVLA